MPAVIVDAAGPDRLPEVSEVHEKSLQEVEHYYWTAEPGPNDLVLVAQRGGPAIVGYLVATIEGATAQIWEQAVLPEHRGFSVGRALLAELALRASRAGCKEIVIDPSEQLDDDRLRDYYRQWGFAESGAPDARRPHNRIHTTPRALAAATASGD
ncbi:MAG: GNAT family N-acetyltransferase [Acidimicrobiales bacterium]